MTTKQWDNLMSAIENDNKTYLDTFREFLGSCMGIENLNIFFICNWYVHSKKTIVSISTISSKSSIVPIDLLPKTRMIYNKILQECPTDSDILRIYNLIHNGPCSDLKISGRTIDLLVTKYPKYYPASYYLDVTDPDNVYIIQYPFPSKRTIILFDLVSAYHTKMHQLSKTYFDCFCRGSLVQHKLLSGKYIDISLCQFMFYIWADRFKVFDFLISVLPYIVKLRDKQPMKIQPVNTVSCLNPDVLHQLKYKRIYKGVAVMYSKRECNNKRKVYRVSSLIKESRSIRKNKKKNNT